MPAKRYTNEQWYAFSAKVKRRDNGQCLQCSRSEPEVSLQVHHEIYIAGKLPWEYSLSDCRTLCKGCHAKQHQLLEPSSGWSLICIEDLGEAHAVCERQHCGNEIRYAHYVYHPNWGYKVVGSTCINFLTQEDQLLSNKLVGLYKNISAFVHSSNWSSGQTKNGKAYLSANYKHHCVRIYGREHHYSFQTVLKEKGVRWHNYGEFIATHNKSLEEVKELAYIALKGSASSSPEEKSLLRNIYRKIK